MAKQFTTPKKSVSLASAKLESSGLDVSDAKALGIDVLGPDETQSLSQSFKPLSSLRFRYFLPDGSPLSDWPKAPPFYRLRYLETPSDFTAQAKKGGPRYVQLPNTAPAAYYPKNQERWTTIVGDTSVPLIITEGELKAAKACKQGFPTIGLGGVYGWRSRKLGLEWLSSLDLVTWLRRNTYLCFDSDYRTNPMVCAALAQLGEALHERGAYVHVVSLPAIEGVDKTGLDDFLTLSGKTADDQFRELLHMAEPLGLTRPLWDLNRRYVYVRSPGLIVEQASGAKVSPSAFKDHIESTQTYQERTLKPDGTISFKAVSASVQWLRWPIRNEVSRMTYAPGREKVFTDDTGTALNLWPGWGVDAKKGDVTPFTKLVNHIFGGSEPGAREWFLRWCAFPLQNPGVKMFSSAVIHGIKHGTGKSLIGYTLGRIYGKNFTEIDQRDLHGNFNEWAEGKQFILGDDVTGSDRRADADFLKKLITQRELRVNAKYVPTYVVPDCINYLFTANHPDSFFLEDDDRRFFIHEVQVDPLPEETYIEYDLWLDSGGSAAVFDWLMHLDLGDFNPAAPAFKTHAKMRMIDRVKSDLGSWVRELVASPDSVMRIGSIKPKFDLYTSRELLSVYDPTGNTGTTANGLARELARAGIKQVCDGQPVRLADGSQARFFIIKNQVEWINATPAKVAQHLADGHKPKQRKM